jgi:uncharacterized membrane protein YheB (UPF0754 family)
VKLEIELHVHLHDSPPDERVLRGLEKLSTQIAAMAAKELVMNKDVQTKLDDLTSKVAAETSVTQSVKTLLEGLSAQIAALKDQVAAGGDPTEILAALDTIGATLATNNQALADAVTANTPAA